jgi:dynein heavy chain 1
LSLDGEKQRWEAGSETFKSQMSTIIGDVLLSSAFMAYAGNEIINIIIL